MYSKKNRKMYVVLSDSTTIVGEMSDTHPLSNKIQLSIGDQVVYSDYVYVGTFGLKVEVLVDTPFEYEEIKIFIERQDSVYDAFYSETYTNNEKIFLDFPLGDRVSNKKLILTDDHKKLTAELISRDKEKYVYNLSISVKFSRDMMMVVEYMEPGKIRDEWLIYTEPTSFNSVEVEVPVGKNYEFRVSLQEPIEGGRRLLSFY